VLFEANLLACVLLPRHNSSMSRKTWLAVAAFVQLFLGAYFVLAFFAWVAKLMLVSTFSSEKSAAGFPLALVIWLALALVSFVLYNRTKRRLKNMEHAEPKKAKKETEETTAA